MVTSLQRRRDHSCPFNQGDLIEHKVVIQIVECIFRIHKGCCKASVWNIVGVDGVLRKTWVSGEEILCPIHQLVKDVSRPNR